MKARKHPNRAPVDQDRAVPSRWLPLLLEWGAATFISASFAWSYGFSFATSNQAGYILGALRKVDPSILSHDWLTIEGKLFPAFQYVAWLLLAIDGSGWAMGVANFLVILFSTLLMYSLMRSVVSGRTAVVAFAMLMAVDAITRTHSVAISYLFESVLQPSSLGTLGWLAGCVLFLRSQWLASGIALALGGILHPNFLVLSLPMFGLAHLMLGRSGLLRRALRQFVPVLVMFVFVVPALLEMGSGDVELAQTILFRMRSPHHYYPLAFHADFGPFVAWQLVGLGMGSLFLRSRLPIRRRTTALIVAHVVVVWVGTIFSTVFYVPQVVQLFIWRLAPFCDMWMQIIAFGALARLALRPHALRRVPIAAIAATLFGLLFLMVDANLKNNNALAHTLLQIVGCAVLFHLLWMDGLKLPAAIAARLARLRPVFAQARPALVTLTFLGIWGLATHGPLLDYRSVSTLLTGFEDDEVSMYAWIQSNTPKDAIFVTPPVLERFRVLGHRATVVDWKSHPYTPVGVIEWYQRLIAVTGQIEIRSKFDAESGYNGADAARMEGLKQRYNIDYAVVNTASQQRSLQQYTRVYSNQTYTVLDVTP